MSFSLTARAQMSGEAAFAQDAAQIQIQPIQRAAAQIAEHQLVDKYLRLLGAQFSWYGQAEQQNAMDAAALSREIVAGLRQGTYDAVELGESHSNPTEQKAAQSIVGAILDGGVSVGDFLQEATSVVVGSGKNTKPGEPYGIFPYTEPLVAAHVAVTLMKDQFNPGDDVKAGLKAAGPKILITYTGAAHTSARMRDYIIETLKDSDLSWGKIYPGRPVIEQALQKHHRKPVIIAMEEEPFVVDHVLGAAIKDSYQKASFEQWRANLAALQSAWDQATSGFKSSAQERFVRSSEQPNFYLGIAGGERRAFKLEAIEKIAALPELKAWLGDKKIKSADAGRFSSSECPADGSCCAGWQVTIDKGSKDKFSRTACERDLP